MSSGKNSVGLDCTILKARSSCGVPSSHAQSKAIALLLLEDHLAARLEGGEVGGIDGVGDRDPAVLVEEGDVLVGWVGMAAPGYGDEA